MAQTKNTTLILLEGKLQAFPLYQALHAFESSMIFRKSDGYACLTAAGNPFLGHAFSEANNTAGSSGDLDVYVRRGPYQAQVTITSIAITDVGKAVYASDDGTLTLTSTSNSYVGRVVRYVAANTCIVEFQPVGAVTATVVQQAHIADLKVNYTTGDLDSEAEIISAFNTTNAKINALLLALETAQVLASS